MRSRGDILPPGVYELEGGVPLGAAIPPGFVGPPPEAPQHQIIEPTKGWWRNAGAFGQRFQGRPPTREDADPIPLFEQQFLPGPPKPWWLSWYRFDRRLLSEAEPNLGNWEFRARIIYGVGGIQNIIETDLIQGIQYPIVCSSISVQLRVYAVVATSPYSVAEDCRVTAGCMLGAQGSGGGGLPPTYTTPFYEMGVEAFEQTFAVPDFARSLCFHTDAVADAELQAMVLTFFSGNGLIKEVNVFDLYDVLSQEKGIAIPGGCNQVTLTASVSVNPGRMMGVQFFLAL